MWCWLVFPFFLHFPFLYLYLVSYLQISKILIIIIYIKLLPSKTQVSLLYIIIIINNDIFNILNNGIILSSCLGRRSNFPCNVLINTTCSLICLIFIRHCSICNIDPVIWFYIYTNYIYINYYYRHILNILLFCQSSRYLHS